MGKNVCFNTPTNPCPGGVTDTRCIIYSGMNLTCLGILTNDRLDTILAKLNALCQSGGGVGGSGQTFVEAGCGIDVDGLGTLHNPYTVSLDVKGINNDLTEFLVWDGCNVHIKTLQSVIENVEYDILNNSTFIDNLINTLFNNDTFINNLNDFVTNIINDIVINDETFITNITNQVFNTFNSNSYFTTSGDCIAIPTSHPVQVTIHIATGLAYQFGDHVTIYADSTHYFTGTVVSYNPSTGVLIINSTSNVGSGTFCNWLVSLSSLFGLSIVITEDTNTIDMSGSGTLADPLKSDVILAPGCNAILATANGLLAIPSSSTYLVSGGNVTYNGTGYIYDVQGGSAVINCEPPCTFPDTQITLSAADPTFGRFDAIVVDSSCNVIVLEGTPSLNPVTPFVDSTLYLGLTYIWIAPGSTAPIPNECLYLENTEWTTFSSTVNINVNSTNNPYQGFKDIEGTVTINDDYFTLTRGLSITPMNWTELDFRIRSKGYWADKGLVLQFTLGGFPIGLQVPLFDGSFGLNTNQTTTYQAIRIPINSFGLNTSDTVDGLIVKVLTPNFGSIGFYIDAMCLTVAPPAASGPGLNFQNYLTRTGGTVELGGYGLHYTLLDTRYNFINIDGVPVYHETLRVGQGQQWEVSAEAFAIHHHGQLNATNPLGEVPNPVIRRTSYWEEKYETNVTLSGPMDGHSGYVDTFNIWHWGSFGIQRDSASSKWGGLLQHTFDTSDYLFTWFGGDIGETPLGVPAVNSDMLTQRKLSIKTTGQLQGFKYGTGIFLDNSAPYVLGVQADGNVIEMDASGLGGTTITADNALTMSTATNVQLGSTNNSSSPLLHYTYINTASFSLKVNTSTNGINPLKVDSTTGFAIWANATGGYAIYGESAGTNGIVGRGDTAFAAGIYGQSQDGWGGFFMVNPTSTSIVVPIMSAQRQVQGGIAANGVGGSFDFNLQVASGTSNVSNRLISKWTVANDATRTSQFIITGVNSSATADLFTLSGNGRTRLNKYGIGTFTGAIAYVSGWDSSGNFIEISPGSLGTDTNFAINDLTATGNRTHTFNTFSTEITYAGLTSGFGWKLSSNNTGAAADTQRLFVIDLSGANTLAGQTTYGGWVSNSHTGSAARNIGMYSLVNNGVTNSAGFWGDATTQYGVLGTATSGIGVRGEATNGTGVYGTGTSGAGVVGTSVSSFGVTGSSQATGVNGTSTGGGLAGSFSTVASSTNTILETLQINRSSTGTAANGIGTKISLNIQTDTGIPRLSNEIISKWTNAVNSARTSTLILTGVNNAVTANLLELAGTGALKLDKYGINTFAGTASYILGVDATGNVVETALAGSSGYATVQDEGSSLTQRSILNFVGAGVSAADDGSSKTVVTIPGWSVEESQDAIGAMIGDTLTIDLTYVDATPLLKADLIVGTVDNTQTELMVWTGTEIKLRDVSSITIPTPTWQQTLNVAGGSDINAQDNEIHLGTRYIVFADSPPWNRYMELDLNATDPVLEILMSDGTESSLSDFKKDATNFFINSNNGISSGSGGVTSGEISTTTDSGAVTGRSTIGIISNSGLDTYFNRNYFQSTETYSGIFSSRDNNTLSSHHLSKIYLTDGSIDIGIIASGSPTSPTTAVSGFHISTSSGNTLTDGTHTILTINHETTDVDKFLVSNAGQVKYRTGAELLSDIGGVGAQRFGVTGEDDSMSASRQVLSNSFNFVYQGNNIVSYANDSATIPKWEWDLNVGNKATFATYSATSTIASIVLDVNNGGLNHASIELKNFPTTNLGRVTLTADEYHALGLSTLSSANNIHIWDSGTSQWGVASIGTGLSYAFGSLSVTSAPTPLNTILAATGTNTINSANFAQEWQWNTLSSNTAMKLSSTSTAAASNTQKLFALDLSGTNSNSNQTTYGAYISNSHAGTGAINYGLYVTATNGSNFAIRGDASSSGLGNPGAATGVYGSVAAGGYGVLGVGAGSGTGVRGESSTGFAIAGIGGGTAIYGLTTGTSTTAYFQDNRASTNTVVNSIIIDGGTTGTAAAGIGRQIQWLLEVDNGSAAEAGDIYTKLTTATAASYVSDMVFRVATAATMADTLILKGDKSVEIKGYGSGTITGTDAYWLAVTSAGKIIEKAAPGAGSGHTIQEDGTPLTTRANLNFDEGLLATDDSGNSASKVVIVGWNQWRNSTLTTSSTGAQTVVSIATVTYSRGILIVDMIGTETSDQTKGLTGTKYVHWKNDGGTVTVLQVIDQQADYRETWSSASWTVDASGANLRIRVTPESSNGADWNAAYKLKYNTYTL